MALANFSWKHAEKSCLWLAEGLWINTEQRECLWLAEESLPSLLSAREKWCSSTFEEEVPLPYSP